MMDEQLYQVVKKKQLDIDKQVSEELAKFKRNNQARRAQVASVVHDRVKKLKKDLDDNENSLTVQKGNFHDRSYFVNKVYSQICEKFDEIFALLENHSPEVVTSLINQLKEAEKEIENNFRVIEVLCEGKINRNAKVDCLKKIDELKDNLEKNSQKLQNLFEDGEEVDKLRKNKNILIEQFESLEQKLEDTLDEPDDEPPTMAASLEDLVRQLAAQQLERKERKSGEVLKTCINVIIKFDKNNTVMFLDSVQLALTLTSTPEEVAAVLRAAKQRVQGSAIIENRTYVKFEDFEADILSNFKPQRTVTEIESLIARLLQEQKETVDAYGKRVFSLKSDYELAARAERVASKTKLDEVRLMEMEKKISNSFINGLKDHILNFIMTRPSTLAESISAAVEAESVSNLRYMNRQLSLAKEKQTERNTAKTGNFKKKPFTGEKREKSFSKHSSDTKSESSPTACNYCKKEGHFVKDCRKLAAKEQEKAGPQPSTSANVAKTEKKSKNGTSCGPVQQESAVSARSVKVKSRH